MFFCFERETSVSNPSSWPFLPCVNPQAPTHVPASGNLQSSPGQGGEGQHSSFHIAPLGDRSQSPRFLSRPCFQRPRRLKFLISLWLLSSVLSYQSHLSFQLTFLQENVEVKQMMATWTLQKGIPLVVVNREGRSLRLQQERFLNGVFKEDPEWGALQERWLLSFCRSSLPHLSLFVIALAFFQLLWQLYGVLFLHRTRRPKLALISAQTALLRGTFLVILGPPLEPQFWCRRLSVIFLL